MPATFQSAQNDIRNVQALPFVGGTNILKGETPKAVPCLCDFSATGVPAAGYTIDVTALMNRGVLRSVQTLYLDNSANNGYLTVSSPTFSQSFSLPPGYQGYFPVIAAEGSGGIFYVTSTGNLPATVTLLNVLFPIGIWPATVTPLVPGLTQPVSDAILDATVSGGRQLVTSKAAQFTATDRSGTIAVGGTQQVLMAANPARQGFLLQNTDSTNIEGLWINPTGAAVIGGAGSFELSAGADINNPGGSFQGVYSGAISIIAATAGHKFSAIEW